MRQHPSRRRPQAIAIALTEHRQRLVRGLSLLTLAGLVALAIGHFLIG